MLRTWLGFVAPLVVTVVILVISPRLPFTNAVTHGMSVGFIIALVQSLVSVMAMKATWTTKWFYWAWGGGMLFRMLVFAGTAFVVYRGVGLDFVATMTSLVVATTIFLVFESSTIFGKR